MTKFTKTMADAPNFWRQHSRKILGAAFLLLLLQDVFGAHGFWAMWRTRRELTQLRGEVMRLNQENGQLADQVKSLKTDPKAIERIAREEMGLARPGEMIFKLPAPIGQSSPGQSPTGQPADSQRSR